MATGNMATGAEGTGQEKNEILTAGDLRVGQSQYKAGRSVWG